jgi:hypothetical protein
MRLNSELLLTARCERNLFAGDSQLNKQLIRFIKSFFKYLIKDSRSSITIKYLGNPI